MIILNVLSFGSALIVLVPLTIMIAETISGLRDHVAAPNSQQVPITCVVVVPAHNEMTGIGVTLQKLKDELPAGFKILVVADNCSDETGAIARSLGVMVAERNDPARKGKGYALAFARDFLAEAPPQSVIILDADSSTDSVSLCNLANFSVQADRPAQAVVELVNSQMPTPMVQVSNFAYKFKSQLRQAGLMNFGGGIFLGGTGMAFPWPIFKKADFGSAHIVEDLALGVKLAKEGKAASLAKSITIFSESADQTSTIEQRTRWEHGFLNVAVHQALPLIWTGITKRNRTLFFMGLHLAVPPLAMLFILGIITLTASLVLAMLGASIVPAIAMFLGLGLASLIVLIAWAKHGRETLAVGTLIRLPLYLLWKLPIYLRLFGRRQKEWNRTNRTTPDELP